MCELHANATVAEDPTRQAGNRRRAMANLRKRLKGAQEQVLELFNAIPVTVSANNSIVNNRVTYEYQLSPERQAQTDALIRQIINQWFETQYDEKPARWFFETYLSEAATQAAADSVNRISVVASPVLSTAQMSQLQVENYLLQPQFQTVIQNIYGRVFNEMKGFAGDTAADLARVLADTVVNGQSPRAAQKAIRERFGVASSRAERISRTEINRAYTVARTKTIDNVSANLGIEIKVLHRSSLIANTRRNHAARHGNVYTTQEQNDFWAQNANRINCLCSISEAVVDNDGNLLDRGLQKKMQAQREIWMKSN